LNQDNDPFAPGGNGGGNQGGGGGAEFGSGGSGVLVFRYVR
jgi:hypothetical protein